MIVWLSSYPRSGNTFFRVILNTVFGIKTYSIYDDRGDIGADAATAEIVGHEFLPDDFDVRQARNSEETFYIKTHELQDERIDPEDKVIYLIRDGRESTLSFTRHQNSFADTPIRVIDAIYGNTFIGAWGDHVASWDPADRANTLLIKFEALTEDPVGHIERIGMFLQREPVGETIPTFEELKAINPVFFRSGKHHSWEAVYSEEEHTAFWLCNYAQMIAYGYRYKMPQAFVRHGDSEQRGTAAMLRAVARQNAYSMRLSYEQRTLLHTINAGSRRLQESQQHAIAQKEQELQGLREQLQRKQAAIDSLDADIQQKRNEIGRLNAVAEDRRKIAEQKSELYRNQVAINEQQLRQLEQKQELIDQKTKDLQQKQELIDQKNKELHQKQEIADQKDRQLRELQTFLDEKTQQSLQTKKALDKRIWQIEDHQAMMEKLNSLLRFKDDVIEEQKERLTENNGLLKLKDDVIEKQKERLTEKDEAFRRSNEALAEVQAKNKVIEKMVNDIVRSKKYKLANLIASPYLAVKGKL